METPQPAPEQPESDQRWTGRARVTPPAGAGGPVAGGSGGAGSGGSAAGRAGGVYGGSGGPGRAGASVGVAGGAVPPTRKKLKPRWGRIVLVCVVALSLVLGGIALWGVLWAKNVDDHLKRTGSIDSMVGGTRPSKAVDGAVNILLLGSDSRDPDQPTNVGGNWRTDTIELMHIPADHSKAYLISFPRDLWVHIPKSTSSQYGDTDAKINAATAWGGVPLVVATVEQYTGVRIDHLALVDFAGFVKVTDALGGVDMNIEKTIKSIHPPYRTFHAGMNHLNGAEALDYVRQRKQFADGDFARMRHQHEFLAAVLDKAVSAGTVTNISTLTSFVSSVADAVTVDKDFSLIDMAWQFHNLRAKDLTFITCPNNGTGMVGDQSVVLPNTQKDAQLFAAVNDDTVAAWLSANKASG